MNALVKKEIRLLLPSFGIALLLALTHFLGPDESSGSLDLWRAFPFLLCPAVAIFLALDSFGREFSSNTFTNLLAQPVARRKIWRTKASLTMVALALVLFAWWGAFLLSDQVTRVVDAEDLRQFMLVTGIVALTIYSGGLWTVLLFRQMAVAFWFVLLVPGLLIVLMTAVWEIQNKSAGTEIIVGVMVAYAIAGFIFARQLFLRAQDLQWTGGIITLPSWVKLPSRLATLAGHRARRPLRALIAKEFHLHQAQFVMAGVLALLHLGVVLLRHLAPALAVRYGFLDLLYKGFWVLWLVMPFLVGCAAVAEERRVGTLEAQLCLPTRRRTQFFIKFAVAVGIALLLGVVVPCLFEGHRILPEIKFGDDAMFSAANIAEAKKFGASTWWSRWNTLVAFVREILPALMLGGISTLSVSAAFYASSFARNTLQALAPGVLGFVAVTTLLMTAHSPELVFGFPPWRGPLIYVIGVPVLAATLGWLTYWNFKRVVSGWIVWRRNIFAVIGVVTLVMLVTTAIFHRTWELLPPLEPAHGPARFARGTSVKFEANNSSLLSQLPDGSLRLDNFAISQNGLWSMLTRGYELQLLPQRSRFPEGTNWVGVADCSFDQAWLKSDGSLWVPEKPASLVYSTTRPAFLFPLVRKGPDADWKQIASYNATLLLLKRDGSLWQLGERLGAGWQTNWPGFIGFQPKLVGTNSDWTDLFSLNQQPYLRRKDGSLWSIQPNETGNSSTNVIVVYGGFMLYPASHLGAGKWQGLVWVNVPLTGGLLVGVHEDGRFSTVANWEQSREKNHENKRPWVLKEMRRQIGSETNWVAIAGTPDFVVTLRADRTLWRWTFLNEPIRKPDSAVATRLGMSSDWVGVVNHHGGVITLAADGSLWLWQRDPESSYYSRSPYESFFRPLQAPSRKPQLIGNIFSQAE